ncbi:MAG TPA: NifU family protein [bacterium]|nr:NifU family protein [bacterium]HPP87111.1 NifU family protein [bacterium]
MQNQKQLKEKVLKELDNIKLYLQADGGDIEFVALKGKLLKLRFKGKCANCPNNNLTFKMGIEREIKDKLPEINQIEMVV